jgi:hypothetical protein
LIRNVDRATDTFGISARLSGIVLVAAALACLLIGVPACDRTGTSISQDLAGVWVTDHPQYRDRFLQFSADTITFGWGAGEVASYTIDAMESEKTADGILISIQYSDLANNEYQITLGCKTLDAGKLWMKNQKQVVWQRNATEPTHEPHYR